MPKPGPGDVVNFIVRSEGPQVWSVFENGFEKPIAEFASAKRAEEYALRIAESKLDWKVDVFDASGEMVATYNSEDDAMPKPTAA